jgi:hypothetical protein
MFVTVTELVMPPVITVSFVTTGEQLVITTANPLVHVALQATIFPCNWGMDRLATHRSVGAANKIIRLNVDITPGNQARQGEVQIIGIDDNSPSQIRHRAARLSIISQIVYVSGVAGIINLHHIVAHNIVG